MPFCGQYKQWHHHAVQAYYIRGCGKTLVHGPSLITTPFLVQYPGYAHPSTGYRQGGVVCIKPRCMPQVISYKVTVGQAIPVRKT